VALADAETQTEALGAFSVVVSLPSYRLSPNGPRNRYERARLAKAARDEAALACAVIPAHDRPLWPRGTVSVSALIVLPKGGRRLDDDNAKALFKNVLDGVQGLVVANDRQLEWGAIRWERDARVTAGIARLEFMEAGDGDN
jgi:hypothetical protein